MRGIIYGAALARGEGVVGSDDDQDSRMTELVGHVYNAALDQGLWTDLAPKIAAAFGSPSASLNIQNHRAGTVNRLAQTANYEPALIEAHRAHYYKCDVWVAGARRLGMTKVLSSNDLVPDEAFERTEFYQDFIRKLGVFYVVGTVFPVAEGELGVLGIHRPRLLGNYDDADKGRLSRFLPHLQHALLIARRLSTAAVERHAAVEGLDRVGLAVAVVEPDGAVIYANSEAERLLRDGDAIKTVGGRLAVNTRDAAVRLNAMVRTAAGVAAAGEAAGRTSLAIPRGERLPLTVLVAPFCLPRHAIGIHASAAVLFIRDPETPTLSTIALQELFGLTAAEAAIAAVLADGKSAEEIAGSNRISLHTVRTHLKSILGKTGTARQAELVVLLHRSVAGLDFR